MINCLHLCNPPAVLYSLPLIIAIRTIETSLSTTTASTALPLSYFHQQSIHPTETTAAAEAEAEETSKANKYIQYYVI